MRYLNAILKQFVPDLEVLVESSDEDILKQLLKRGIEKTDILKALERHYGFECVDVENTFINQDILGEFNISVLKRQSILPLKRENRVYQFAMSDPLKQQLKEHIAALCLQKGFEARFFFAFSSEIQAKYIDLENNPRQKPQQEEIGEFDAVAWVDQAIKKGATLQASDIHIEPQEQGCQVRYRVDGILAVKDIFDFSQEKTQSIISRIKIISGMDIAEKRKPHDGRIDRIMHQGKRFDLRVSTVPTIHGEKAVLRIFNQDDDILSFTELGFTCYEEKQIQKLLNSPYGIIYLAGATGSGKTTTLYTMINSIKSDEVNISTIEDPVERTIKGVNQIQINSQLGNQCATNLRALLRQDPDVIVVGEVRDKETAELCIRASLTGHLVLSTVHANNAIDTVSRMHNMGIEPYMLSAGTLGLVSQRLIRVLCPSCKIKTKLASHERAWVKYIAKKYQEEESDSFYEPAGCQECNNIGYKGRTSVVEIVTLDEELKDMIANRKTSREIYKKAQLKGYIPIERGSYRKAVQGITSVVEAMRAM